MANLPSTLNSFWLWYEVSSKFGVSNPAYNYWKNTSNMKFNDKYVVIQKETLADPSSHLPIQFVKDLEFSIESTFYRLKDNYAIVVHE